MPTPPGSYEIWLVPKGEYSVPVSFGRVSVPPNRTVEFDVSSAVRFAAEGSPPPLDHWRLLDSRGEVVAQAVERWGLAAVPPGRYRLETDTPEGEVRSDLKEVTEGAVTTFTPTDLGVSRVDIAIPDEEQLGFLFGGDALHPLLEIEDDVYKLDPPADDVGGVTGFWLEARPIAVEIVHGAFRQRTELDLQAGEIVSLPFDPEILAREQGLALLAFENPEAAVDVDRMVVMAAAGSRALLSDPDFDFSKRYLAPASSVLLAVSDGTTTQHGPFPAGQTALIDGRQLVADKREPEPVNVVVEAPTVGEAFPADIEEVEVIGDASAVGLAGTTKIALVVDVSASTGESSGADVDGDGRADSVLKAEVAAAEALINALSDIEAESPGTAFSVALLAFGETAQVLAPFAPLTDPAAVAALSGSLANLSHAMQGSDTFYDRGLDAARRLHETAATPGPAVAILITDGKPSQIAPGIDAAARLGAAGVALHSIGLGADFRGTKAPALRYPPLPDSGPEILASLSAFGAEGGQVWLLPKPADVVDIVSELPVLETVDAGIAEVTVVNETTGASADEVTLSDDGSFKATVPVRFDPEAGIVVNLISVRAIAGDTGDTTGRSATAQVHVVVEGGAEQLDVQRDAERDAFEQQIAALSNEMAARESETDEAHARIEQLRGEMDTAAAASARALEEQSSMAAAREASVADERDAERERRIAAETRLTAAEDTLRDMRLARDEAVARVGELETAMREERERADAAASQVTTVQGELESAHRALGAAVPRGEMDACQAEILQCQSDLNEALNAAVPVQPSRDSVVLTFPGDVLFDFASSRIRPDAEGALRLAALYIRENKRSDVIVEGHTDGIGSSEANKALSLARAESVKTWLVDSDVVTEEQIRASGFGEERPLEPEARPDGSDDPDARQRNRRVEIRLLQ